jgi:transcriptional regulator with XRE-family HTH domain
MEDNQIEVGSRIRYFRQLKNMSQLALANEANINPAFLGHLERNIKHPTIQTLEKITSALGISLSEFFDYPTDTVIINHQLAVEKITLALKNLPEADANRIADIVCEMVKIGKGD